MSETRSEADARVVVVDDDEAVVGLVRDYLGRHDGISVTASTDPTEALEVVRAASPAAVVSDYDMPEMDGIEFLTVVREHHPDVPCILFTSVDDEELVESARQRDADFLRKGGDAGGYRRLAEQVREAVEAT